MTYLKPLFYFPASCFLEVKEDGPHHTLPVGEHRWAFAFRLPKEMLPSSFEGEHGAIRWYLKVEVDKPFPSINNKWYRTFTVLSKLDMNEAVYQVSYTVRHTETHRQTDTDTDTQTQTQAHTDTDTDTQTQTHTHTQTHTDTDRPRHRHTPT